MANDEFLPAIDSLIWGLVCKGRDPDARAMQRTLHEIRSLPVTYTCPNEEA